MSSSVAEPEVARLRGIAKSYGEAPGEVRALSIDDLAVRRGEMTAVVGPSGSGKSTLLNILGLIDEPTSGTYLLDGEDVAGLGERERTERRRRSIGFVFQAHLLSPRRTALENVLRGIMLGEMPRRERVAVAREALADLGLGGLEHRHPDQLSGGQQQRVALARAVAKRPTLLLCDEPTGQLDTELTKAVTEALLAIADAGVAVVVATHDPLVADHAATKLRLVDGEVA